MWRTVSSITGVLALTTLLGGCGLLQSVGDGTRDTARAVFYKQVRTLHLDISGRAALNTDLADMNTLSVPTLVRVYQLSGRKRLDRAGYQQLLDDGDQVLGAELLEQRALMVNPEQGVRLNQALHRDARYVAVVALFRHPEPQANTWRLVLERDDLDPDAPRTLELGDNHLSLRPLAE